MTLLERDSELATLTSVWERARAGSGRLAVVQAVAGNGKSALLAAAAENAAEQGLLVLRARGSELERGFPFGAVRQLFERLVVQASPAARHELFAGAAAPAARLLDADQINDGEGMTEAVEGFLMHHAVYWLAINLSERRPLALLVDDLHWVDPSSIRALTYLAHRVVDLPIAVAVAMRPDEPGTPNGLLDELSANPDAVAIRLRTLHLRSVTALVRATVPDADDDLCAACFSATAGNPFYLRELLVTVTADRAPGGAPVVEAIAVPIIGDRVMRRIARVGPDAAALAQVAAVLDEGGRLADAAALAGLPEATAARVAYQLQRIDVLAAVDPLTFAHPLVRRSLYDTLSLTERDDIHTAAATRLAQVGAPSQIVAAHLASVRPAGHSQVALALRDAATDAARRGAPDAAVRWLERALVEGAAQPPRAELLHALGRVEVAARDPAAIAHLRGALDNERDPVRRGRITLDLAEILAAAGQWESAATLISQAVDGLQDRDDVVTIDLQTYRALIRANDPRLVSAFDADRDHLLELTAGDGWSARALAVLIGNIQVWRGQSLEQARLLVEHGLRDWVLFAEHDAGGWASAQALTALVLLDDDDRSLEVVAELLRRAERAGALIGSLTAMGYRAWVSARRGDLSIAEAEMRPLIAVSMQNSMALLVATASIFLVDAVLERPSLDDIAELVEQADMPEDFLASGGGAWLLEARGRWRVARGDHERGLADLRRCGEVHTALGFGPPLTHWRSALALALPGSKQSEARSLVETELELAAATGLARPHGVALHRTGLVVGGPDGLEHLRHAVARLGGSHARLEHARALVDYGAALRRTGRRVDARAALRSGAELAHRCAADRLARRAVEELQAAGARPRRLARTGLDALTPSELRTVRLVSQGGTNVEVAQSLFVSLKTVETHLLHAYAKLGLAGAGARHELGKILGCPPTPGR